MTGLLTGFADADAARAAACQAKIRQRLASLAGRIGASLGERLHQEAEPQRRALTTLLAEGIDLALRNIERRFGDLPITAVDGQDMGQQQLLQRHDLILHLAEALLQLLVHDSSESSFDGNQAIRPVGSTHRLSGDAK